jgi:long-chain acyl-CoA synthetase
MERIWLKHYPPGISAEIDPSRYSSLVVMLEESFAKYRERTAFICMDKGLAYGEIDEMSRALGA